MSLPRGVALLALLSLLAPTACRTVPIVPALVPLPAEEERVRVWIEELRESGAARTSIRAFGKLRIESPDGRAGSRQVILARRPAQLRLESLNLLGQTQTLLVTDGQEFSFFDGRRLVRGVVTPDVLLERLGLDLEPHQAVQLLLGLPPPLNEESPVEILSILGRGEERIVHLSNGSLHFGGTGELMGAELRGRASAARVRVAYSSWRELPGGRYPFEMVLEFPRTRLRAELQLREVELDPELDPALFQVPPRESE